MLTKTPQGQLAPKGICRVSRTLADTVLDMSHKCLSQDRLHHLSVYPAITPQKIINATFAYRASASLLLMSSPKIGLIEFNLSRKLSKFQFSLIKVCHSQPAIHPGNSLGIKAQITRQLISPLLLITALQGNDVAAQIRGAFLLCAKHTLKIAMS
jgi:hypothetical protein